MKFRKLKKFAARSVSAAIALSMTASPVAVHANEISPVQTESSADLDKNEEERKLETAPIEDSGSNTKEVNATDDLVNDLDEKDIQQELKDTVPGGEISDSDEETPAKEEKDVLSSEEKETEETGTENSLEGEQTGEPSVEEPSEETESEDKESDIESKEEINTELEMGPETEIETETEENDDLGINADTDSETEEEIEEEINSETSTEQKPETKTETIKKKKIYKKRLSSGTTYRPVDKYEVPVYLYDDFRFWTVEKVYSFANKEVKVLDDMKNDATEIGVLEFKDVAYILLTDSEDEWAFIESGDVRGFVRTENLFRGEDAKEILIEYQEAAGLETDEEKEEIDFEGHFGKTIVNKYENRAFAYVRMTTHNVVVDKVYALPTADSVDVKEGKTEGSRTVGTICDDGLAYVIADSEEEWIYIESGDIRGFVHRNDIIFDETIQKEVMKKGEDAYTAGIKMVEPKENSAVYYTVTSVKEGERCSDVGMRLVNFASQFIGNEYVWGGTSLTDGADCSGFVQSVFKTFGYELPRVSYMQAEYGEKIPVEKAAPGDLIFYGNETRGIYHVVIYAGDGKTVEAKNEAYGIGSFNLDYDAAKWAVRVLPDNNMITGKVGTLIKVPEKLGKVYTYMGWQCITAVNSEQYKLRQIFGMNFNDEGFGIINGRYVVATTTTFGQIGDEVDFYLEDGTILPCIIGDIKNQNDNGCTMWGHNDGTNMIEFVVDRDVWYETGHPNPGTDSFHPELSQYVEKVINVGSIYKNSM